MIPLRPLLELVAYSKEFERGFRRASQAVRDYHRHLRNLRLSRRKSKGMRRHIRRVKSAERRK